jgi:hypothetical protein
MSLSHPSTADLARLASRNAVSASVTKGEWQNARIVSLRNLRLPVHTLEAGQVGTIGIVFNLPEGEEAPELASVPRVRKGMVVAIPSHHMVQTGHTLQAASGFTASFEDSDVTSITTGSLVVVYVASVRASARVLRVWSHEDPDGVSHLADEIDDVFGLEERSLEEEEGPDPPIFGSDGITDLTFEFITNREVSDGPLDFSLPLSYLSQVLLYIVQKTGLTSKKIPEQAVTDSTFLQWIELGSQILVMPGGGHGLYHGSERGEKGVAGLEGFVGKVIEVVD